MEDKKANCGTKCESQENKGRNRKRLESLIEDRQTKMGYGSQNGSWKFWIVVLRHVGLRLKAEWDLKGKQEQEDY